MTGLRFGRLIGVGFSHTSPSGRAQWVFACDCGAEIVADGSNVRAGSTTSCGCYHRQLSAARLTRHGHRAGRQHGSTYRAWQSMIDGCANPLSPRWSRCGGIGIGCEPQWHDYRAFLADLGERPAGSILSRIDPAADFGPGNCVWAGRQPRAERAERGWAGRRDRSADPARVRPIAVHDQACSAGFA